MNVRRLVAAAAAVGVIALTACTPQQAQEWLGWHRQDPAAAGAWLDSPEGQESLTNPDIDVPAPPPPAVSWQSGNCASFAEEAAAAGLPWGIFGPIARRESGCNPNAWVVDHDDNGGGLFGFNFKGSMINYWPNLCGMSIGEVRGNVPLQMECAAIQYRRHGLSAWR